MSSTWAVHVPSKVWTQSISYWLGVFCLHILKDSTVSWKKQILIHSYFLSTILLVLIATIMVIMKTFWFRSSWLKKKTTKTTKNKKPGTSDVSKCFIQDFFPTKITFFNCFGNGLNTCNLSMTFRTPLI